MQTATTYRSALSGEEYLVTKRETSKSHAVGFRLGPDEFSRLEELAESRGLSSGMFARSVVLDALANARADMGRTSVELLGNGFHRLEERLGILAYALLTEIGKLDEEQVRHWVRENFLNGQDAG